MHTFDNGFGGKTVVEVSVGSKYILIYTEGSSIVDRCSIPKESVVGLSLAVLEEAGYFPVSAEDRYSLRPSDPDVYVRSAVSSLEKAQKLHEKASAQAEEDELVREYLSARAGVVTTRDITDYDREEYRRVVEWSKKQEKEVVEYGEEEPSKNTKWYTNDDSKLLSWDGEYWEAMDEYGWRYGRYTWKDIPEKFFPMGRSYE